MAPEYHHADDDDDDDEEEEDEEEETESDSDGFEESPIKKPTSVAKGKTDSDDEFDGGANATVTSQKISNDAFDEQMAVDDDHVPTPTKDKPSSSSAKNVKSVSATKSLQNDAHDAEFAVDDAEDVPSARGLGPAAGKVAAIRNDHFDEQVNVSDTDSVASDHHQPAPAARKVPAAVVPKNQPSPVAKKQQHHEADESSDSDSDGGEDAPKSLLWSPDEFKNMPGQTAETRELLAMVIAYKPQAIDLDAKVRPFIPDYIPTVGEIDTFIKIPRTDNKPDALGLSVLDEPAVQQSNPDIVKRRLADQDTKNRPIRADEYVSSLPEARSRKRNIDQWIQDVNGLHRGKPSVNVTYSKPMPDLEGLMQVWPADFEDLLSNPEVSLPGADIDLSVAEYAKLICSMLDIPVYENVIESCHLLFSLYSEFASNQHFQAQPVL